MISDSYGEAIGDPESNSCSGNDDDKVVIEEIPDDEKPAKVNGNRKRRIKKHQVSNSDGDVQKDIVKNDTRIVTVESGDNQLPDSERKFEDIEGCEIERRIVQPTNAPLVSLEIGPETDEAPKTNTVAVRLSTRSTTVLHSYTEPKYDPSAFRKFSCEGSVKKRNVDVESQPAKREKKDVKSSTYSLGGVVYESVKIVDENAEGESRPKNKNLCDDMEAGCVGPKSDEMPKKKKKRVKESQSGGVENNSKIDVQEKDNFIVGARIDDTFKNEPVKVPEIDNLSNDKCVLRHGDSSLLPLEIAHDNKEKLKKKKTKCAKEKNVLEKNVEVMLYV